MLLCEPERPWWTSLTLSQPLCWVALMSWTEIYPPSVSALISRVKIPIASHGSGCQTAWLESRPWEACRTWEALWAADQRAASEIRHVYLMLWMPHYWLNLLLFVYFQSLRPLSALLAWLLRFRSSMTPSANSLLNSGTRNADTGRHHLSSCFNQHFYVSDGDPVAKGEAS